LEAFAENYLSADHRDDPSGGCLLAALGSELARADGQTRRVATEGLLMLADRLAAQFSGVRPQVAKRRALVALATLVGALILARTVTDPKLSSRILREATKHVSTLVS
jgi:TetR/AcrR family transcriptional repressor of nem operon